MADSDNTTTLPLVIRRRVLGQLQLRAESLFPANCRSNQRIQEPYTFTLLASGQEFDTGFYQSRLNGLQSADPGIYLPVFQPDQRIQRHNCLVGKLLLRPTKQGPCGSNLSWTDHGSTIGRPILFATYRVILHPIRYIKWRFDFQMTLIEKPGAYAKTLQSRLTNGA